MAENLQLLKQRIKTAKNISQIAKAMEMISASKIKRAQTAVTNNKPYAEKIISRTKSLVSSLHDTAFNHPYLQKNDSNKKLTIVLSPDKGLCGGLVTNLLKRTVQEINSDTYLIAHGKKIERSATRFPSELIASFHMGTSLPRFSMIYPLKNLIEQYYTTGKVNKVEIIYTEFKSVLSQHPNVLTLLPLTFNTNAQQSEEISEDYIFEPNRAELLSSLLPYYLEISLYSTLLEAYTSEQAARMMAMQNAKNNANDIADALTLSYNKSRQERITNELLDLNNGQVVNA